MHKVIDKDLAVKIFALARQAERSVDRVIGIPYECDDLRPSSWSSLRRYYQGEKEQTLLSIVHALQTLVPLDTVVFPREHFGGMHLLSALFRLLFRWFNKSKRNWRFRTEELAFLVAAFSAFLRILSNVTVPAPAVLIEMRSDFYICERIIANRLLGDPMLKKAYNIENYLQPEHIVHVTMDELLHTAKLTGDSARNPSRLLP